mmetsp:Transcript_6687/g.17092  ORF Transcript_6687/g.17092 Transcript_6687/m.17092 type:complete len:244 (+) Transcript_6687:1822-2553(+)
MCYAIIKETIAPCCSLPTRCSRARLLAAVRSSAPLRRPPVLHLGATPRRLRARLCQELHNFHRKLHEHLDEKEHTPEHRARVKAEPGYGLRGRSWLARAPDPAVGRLRDKLAPDPVALFAGLCLQEGEMARLARDAQRVLVCARGPNLRLVQNENRKRSLGVHSGEKVERMVVHHCPASCPRLVVVRAHVDPGLERILAGFLQKLVHADQEVVASGLLARFVPEKLGGLLRGLDVHDLEVCGA